VRNARAGRDTNKMGGPEGDMLSATVLEGSGDIGKVASLLKLIPRSGQPKIWRTGEEVLGDRESVKGGESFGRSNSEDYLQV